VAPESGHRTAAECRGARQLPFIAGYAPSEEDHCLMDEIRDFFRGGRGAD